MPEGVPNRLYYHYHHKVLEEILPKSIVLVACPADEPQIILGWMCVEVLDTCLVVHYCYVKHDFRKFGVARRLFDAVVEAEKPTAFMFTHRTKAANRILSGKGWLYNPYLLFFNLPSGWQNPQFEGKHV